MVTVVYKEQYFSLVCQCRIETMMKDWADQAAGTEGFDEVVTDWRLP
jgi:hypothetical protein